MQGAQDYYTLTKHDLKEWSFGNKLQRLLKDIQGRNGNKDIVEATITVGNTTWHYRLVS